MEEKTAAKRWRKTNKKRAIVVFFFPSGSLARSSCRTRKGSLDLLDLLCPSVFCLLPFSTHLFSLPLLRKRALKIQQKTQMTKVSLRAFAPRKTDCFFLSKRQKENKKLTSFVLSSVSLSLSLSLSFSIKNRWPSSFMTRSSPSRSATCCPSRSRTSSVRFFEFL